MEAGKHALWPDVTPRARFLSQVNFDHIVE